MSRKLFSIVVLALMMVPAVLAQSLRLPDESPAATVEQRIGLTDITISYHRPQVKGRQVFGSLVPYGQVWRAGANENTTISFTDDVTVEVKVWVVRETGSGELEEPEEKQQTPRESARTEAGRYDYGTGVDALDPDL